MICCSDCNQAAEKGHLECLTALHQVGHPWNQDICINAARNGHLDCLKYAHQNGCSWDQWTCYYAIKNKHFECLRYAYYHGCPAYKENREQAELLIKEIQDKYRRILKQTIQKKYRLCTDVINEIVKYLY